MSLDFSFFSSFYDCLCMFRQPAKICSKSYNLVIFKLIFMYLIDSGADLMLVDSHTHQRIECLVTVNFLFKCVILEQKKKEEVCQ